MNNHPSRSGAISAELFAQFLEELQMIIGDGLHEVTLDYLRHRIMDAALAIAVRRAARKFKWDSNFDPACDIDLAGCVHAPSAQLSDAQKSWIKDEVRKIGKHAFQHVGI